MSVITNWTVDYGWGPQPVLVPHAWRQDVDVRWEGPAVYQTHVEVPAESSWIRFNGVSYHASVFFDGALVHEHAGIWDAFSVSLDGYEGEGVEVRVEVTKNGGQKFPVREVAGGFLPFVFHTFGGIFGEVEIVQAHDDPSFPFMPKRPSRITVQGHRVYLEGKPFYMRGALHWGWFPTLGHTNPPQGMIRKEVQALKEAGFNLVKFCLWLPSHRYLEILKEEGLEAWIELPLWDPTPDEDAQERMLNEFRRIVLQYRHHDNILLWTCGCELSTSTTSDFRRRLVETVKELTGSPLVKDNSGGAEMYGGDLLEFGDFDDFHPYCDTPFYPTVLDSLLPRPHSTRPLFLGEFNDCDMARDLRDLAEKSPYWMSLDPTLNTQGVRWQHDLPAIVAENGWAADRLGAWIRSSHSKSEFIRQWVYEQVRSRREISGFVITGISDTPISTSGFFDSEGRSKGLQWFSSSPGLVGFLIPHRRPPWIRGGNRPGWRDPQHHFPGSVVVKVGLASDQRYEGDIHWTVAGGAGVVAQGKFKASIEALDSVMLGEIAFLSNQPGQYELQLEETGQSWKLDLIAPLPQPIPNWSLVDPFGRYSGLTFEGGPNLISSSLSCDWNSATRTGGTAVLALQCEGVLPVPFWRECTFEYCSNGSSVSERFLAEFADVWHRLLPVSPDCALNPEFLDTLFPSGYDTIMARVDTRNYVLSPLLVMGAVGDGQLIVTCLRAEGGLGVQPFGTENNPCGSLLMSILLDC